MGTILQRIPPSYPTLVDHCQEQREDDLTNKENHIASSQECSSQFGMGDLGCPH